MNSDLISRQAAIDAINHICPVDTEYDCTLLDRVDVRCVLSDLPSAQPKTVCVAKITLSDEQIQKMVEKIKNEAIQVFPSAQPTIEPRAKGEWVYGEHDVAMCDGYRCSHCGFFVPWDYSHVFIDFIKDYHFCPRCGAEMCEEKDSG